MGVNREGWVHLYEFSIRGEPTRADWEALSAAERSRACRVCDPVRMNRLVVRRAALHRILGSYDANVCFNSSHSGDLAAVAVAPQAVGVDIEVGTPRRLQERIAQRMFAPDERSLLEAVDGEARRRLFHRCWVAKEAYAKGRGRGLALRFDAFSVASVLRSPSGTGAVGPDWSVAVRTCGDTHVAVAGAGHDWEVEPVG